MNLAIFTSGYGSLLKPLVDNIVDGNVRNTSLKVIVNSHQSWSLQVAFGGVAKIFVLPNKMWENTEMLGNSMIDILEKADIDWVILANFIKFVPESVVSGYNKRIINIHPALLPNHGGQGMHGEAVFKSILESGDKDTGVTVHYVDENYDTGDIIHQLTYPVEVGDTSLSLSDKAVAVGNMYYWKIIDKVINGEEINEV